MKKIAAFVVKNWGKIIIAAVIIFLLSIIFKGCGNNKELAKKNKDQYNELVRKDNILKAKEASFAVDSAEKEKVINQYDTLIQDITADLNVSQTDLKAKGRLVRRLLQEAASHDPNISDSIDRLVASKIDSAASEFDQLSLKYASMEYNMSELIEAQIAKDSAQQAQLKAAYDELNIVRAAYANVFYKYNLLQADFNKVAKKVKNRTFLNRVLAAGVLATGTLYLLK